MANAGPRTLLHPKLRFIFSAIARCRSKLLANHVACVLAGTRGCRGHRLYHHNLHRQRRCEPAGSAQKKTAPESASTQTRARPAFPVATGIRDRAILTKPRIVPLVTTLCRWLGKAM